MSQCRICGESARYSYYGAVVCQSCKMFFKRNAETRQDSLVCHFRNQCSINSNNRHTCPCCRLAKCFNIGMRIEMIRSCRNHKNKQRIKKQLIDNSKLTTNHLFLLDNENQLHQISTLSSNHWNLLSNLVNHFDEHGGYSYVQQFIHEQNVLPVKLRFKLSAVRQFFLSIQTKMQFVFENNQHFLLLSRYDRQILLRQTIEHRTILGALFAIRQHQLFDNASFYHSTELIFQSQATTFMRQITDRLDLDDTLIKLIMAILSFSTNNSTVYTKSTKTTFFLNIRRILAIQNLYVDLTWRYILYKYGYVESILKFNKLIQCIFLVNDVIVHAYESQEF